MTIDAASRYRPMSPISASMIGAVFAGAPADALATLLGAVGDGLLLHALLDPDLDVYAALNALRALLAPRPS
jgi:hypothetical protein